MKFLFAGLGSIGQRHLKNLYSMGYRDFLAHRTKEAEDSFEKEFGVKRVKSFEQGLVEKPDAVFVTNPTSLHVSYALRAVMAGSHVFIEKPLSNNMDGVDELIQNTEKMQRIVFVGYHLRFHPVLRSIKAVLEKGVIGKPIAAHISVGQNLSDWHPDEDYKKSYASQKKLGGGVILTLSHELDYASWLFGRPLSVYCLGGHKSNLMMNVEDVAKMLVEFESGCIADIHLDYLQRPARREFQVIGEKGKIEWDYFSDHAKIILHTGSVQELTLPVDFNKNMMYLDEVKNFINVIKGKEKQRSTLEDAVNVLKFSMAALESMEKKAPIFIT